jgi:hypothetical protein
LVRPFHGNNSMIALCTAAAVIRRANLSFLEVKKLIEA